VFELNAKIVSKVIGVKMQEFSVTYDEQVQVWQRITVEVETLIFQSTDNTDSSGTVEKDMASAQRRR
jgi:hypothetical protein